MRECIVHYFIYVEISRKEKKHGNQKIRSWPWLGVEQESLQMLRRKYCRMMKSELVVVMAAQLYITKKPLNLHTYSDEVYVT